MEDNFELVFKPYRHDKTFRMQVQVIHRTDQVIRFKITGGSKFLVMEKLLYKKTGSWKIQETNFGIGDSPTEQTAYTIFELQNLLDYHIKKDDDKPQGNPKWEH